MATATKHPKQSTELIALAPEQFPALAQDVAETIRQNMGGEQITPADLTRIRVPAGGATVWTIPTADGETTEKELTGVLIHITRRRAYWKDATPTGEPPACTSADCLRGIGEPGGSCEVCPLNIFGSGRKPDGTASRGKACKETKLLFLLRASQTLPEVVVVPAGSLRAVKAWQLKLGKPYFQVLTQLSLEKTKNRDGIAFAQIKPQKIGDLEPATAAAMQRYAKQLEAVFAAVTVDHSDLAAEEEPTEV